MLALPQTYINLTSLFYLTASKEEINKMQERLFKHKTFKSHIVLHLISVYCI